MSGPLDAALALADTLNWRILPCEPEGKDPIVRLVHHGVKDASTDPDVIRGWWAEEPDANPAVACGPPGPDVLDLDDPSHPQARELLDQLAAAPRVASVRGPHVYLSGGGNRVLPFGELRSTGWYVLAPPACRTSP